MKIENVSLGVVEVDACPADALLGGGRAEVGSRGNTMIGRKPRKGIFGLGINLR